MSLFVWLDSVQQSLQLVRQPGGKWVAQVYGFRRRHADPGYGKGPTADAAIWDLIIRSSGDELVTGSGTSITMPENIEYQPELIT